MALAGSWCLWDVCLNNTTLNRVIRQMFAACSAASLAPFPDVPAVGCCVTFSVCLTQTEFFFFVFPYWIWKKKDVCLCGLWHTETGNAFFSLRFPHLKMKGVKDWQQFKTKTRTPSYIASNSKNTLTSGLFSFLRRGNVVTALMSLRLIAPNICVSTSSLQRKCFLRLFYTVHAKQRLELGRLFWNCNGLQTAN